MEKLNIKAIALSLGIVFGAYMFLLGIAASFGWGTEIVGIISSGYIGYGPTLLGALIGAVYGFIDGAIGGAIFAWLYNKLSRGK
ncbi:bacteriophage holin [Candidatus Woesearchaeota archaeon]|nr:bacteriophage holin [Candidatus Woesearchaeota archaeon]